MSADLAVFASDPTSLEVFDDPGQQIVLACERANAWLKAGIGVRIETIVETKAQAAAVAAFAVQKQLGHDAELAALEVQRRAERGIGLAIRRGQESGEIRKAERHGVHDANSISPHDAAELPKTTVSGIYDLTDGVTDEAFDEAIEEAKAEANLSRANVTRKVKKTSEAPRNRAANDPKRLDKIRDLAAQGYASPQIAREVGHTEDYVRRLARDNHIEIHADKAVGRRRRIDSNQVAAEIVATLEQLALPMRLVNFAELNPSQAGEWANSLTESIRALNRFTKQIKELAQ